MARPPARPERLYPTYEPYPISWDTDLPGYRTAVSPQPRDTPGHESEASPFDDLPDFVRDAPPSDWQESEPLLRDGDPAFRPLRLLRSLFADRLDLLNSALAELEGARERREQLTEAALRDIDYRIQECDRAIATLKREKALNNFDKRKHLERQLVELKRQRRQEAVTNWRDLVALDREIRALTREVDSLGRTAATAKEERAST